MQVPAGLISKLPRAMVFFHQRLKYFRWWSHLVSSTCHEIIAHMRTPKTHHLPDTIIQVFRAQNSSVKTRHDSAGSRAKYLGCNQYNKNASACFSMYQMEPQNSWAKHTRVKHPKQGCTNKMEAYKFREDILFPSTKQEKKGAWDKLVSTNILRGRQLARFRRAED